MHEVGGEDEDELLFGEVIVEIRSATVNNDVPRTSLSSDLLAIKALSNEDDREWMRVPTLALV